jgi:hypothetical protein
MKNRAVLPFALILAVFSISAAGSEYDIPPEQGGRTKSMGFPPRADFYLGLSAGQYRGDGTSPVLYGKAGIYHGLFNPVSGAAAVILEGYAGLRKDISDGGIRAMMAVPAFRIAFGADYNFRDNHADFIMSFNFVLRRGGVVGGGSSMNIDWMPGRGHSFNISLNIPVFGHYKGVTRPRQNYTVLPDPASVKAEAVQADAAVAEALGNISTLSWSVTEVTVPYIDHDARTREKALEKFSSDMEEISSLLDSLIAEEVVRALHAEIERAFSMALSGKEFGTGESSPAGRDIAFAAREIVLEEVLLPYNAKLGMWKKKDTTTGLAVAARTEFGKLVTGEGIVSGITSENRAMVERVFDAILESIESCRKQSKDLWGDSRLVWLPFQLALLPEQHDEQAEIDLLIERAVGVQFTVGNGVSYVINEQFQKQFYRMVQEAEDYHILWIHDFAGEDRHGNPDEIAFEQTCGYLKALADRAREYDETGKIPVYMIFLDQFYFEANGGRLFLGLLEKPLDYSLDLPKEHRWMEDSITVLQEELRSAVGSSRLLRERTEEFGNGWLSDLVKVHIYITNPLDLSFWARDIIPVIGISDNLIRDHRKVSLHDITEADPYRGEAIYTGMGVGEHYTGSSWEDRAVLLRGPAALGLKDEARELLLSQGFSEDEVPWPLRKLDKPASYDSAVAAVIDSVHYSSWGVMQLHNRTGYQIKRAGVAKAVLYTMMPPRSVLKIPDSLWNSHLWGSMVLGAAIRGCRVLVISPALEDAPSAGFPQMSRAQETWERFIVARDILGGDIEAAGGMLRIGMYSPQVGVGDLVGRVHELEAALEEHAWLKELHVFDQSFFDAIDRVDSMFREKHFRPEYLDGAETDGKPKLHLKAQFFASADAWDEVMGSPMLGELLVHYFERRIEQIEHSAIDYEAHSKHREFGGQVQRKYVEQAGLADDWKPILYLTVGSQNMNNRSMLMDGEVIVVMSHFEALAGLIDFLLIAGLCDWVDTREDLERLLPAYGGTKRKIARTVRHAS